MTDTDQWLSTGDCKLCRRRKYCNKPCKPSQRRQAMELTNMVAGAVYKAMARTLTPDGHEE